MIYCVNVLFKTHTDWCRLLSSPYSPPLLLLLFFLYSFSLKFPFTSSFSPSFFFPSPFPLFLSTPLLSSLLYLLSVPLSFPNLFFILILSSSLPSAFLSSSPLSSCPVSPLFPSNSTSSWLFPLEFWEYGCALPYLVLYSSYAHGKTKY